MAFALLRRTGQVFLLLFLLTRFWASAQIGIGPITKRIPTPTGSFVLDSLTLMSPTLKCLSDTSVRLSFDFKTNTVTRTSGLFSGDSVTFRFYTYPFAAYKPIFRYRRADFDSLLMFADYPDPGFGNGPGEKREELFAMPGIQKSGAITRGISVGNNQNGFVNSSLNLQLEGQISPQIRLTAVMSDQNVPFQPQGNTQQVRELDRIYIQLDHRQGQLIAGDVVLKNEPSQFLRYYKNIQGGQLTAAWDTTQNSQTRVAAGIAKGKFASIIVQVKEGVQGPYRLRPPNNPDFSVVILANSERIYFDSRLLKRGFNQDYVIDYNTGELTLNNNLQVTAFTRLRADFEYSERNYSRTVVMGEHTEKVGIAQIQVSHYQEQDNPNRPLSFTLDSTNSGILNKAGDDPFRAVLPTAQLSPNFVEGQIYYNKRDTSINQSVLSYYRYAPATSPNLYQVIFSEVGQGRGDYQLLQNLGNGKIFVFTGPGTGNYLPIRFAVLPNKRSMSRASILLNPSEDHKIEIESALSAYDKNRFSRLDEGDNSGNSQYIGYQWSPVKSKEKLPIKLGVNYTRLSKTFNPIDRFRTIEFDRDWNANSGDTLIADDHLVQAYGEIGKPRHWNIRYNGAYRNKGDNVKGSQHTMDIQHKIRYFDFAHQGFVMQNIRPAEKADWVRLSSEVMLTKYTLMPGYRYQSDENAIAKTGTDSVIALAMNYRAHSLFLKSKDTTRRFFTVDYTYREDRRPIGGALTPSLFSHNGTVRAGAKLGENHRVDLTGNYRQFSDGGVTDAPVEENLAGRLDYAGSLWDGAVKQEFTYTTNTGQEQRRTFQFVRITDLGQGTHQWIDANGNGIQELDEFVEALRPEDRQYIKIFTPTNDFIKAYTNLLNYRLNLSAPSDWQSGTGAKPILARFSLLSSISSEQKSVNGGLKDRYLPLVVIQKAEIVSASRVVRNTLFWNRTQSNIGGEYSLIQSQQKTLLSNGFSLRKVREHRFLFRKNLSSYVNLTQFATWFERGLESDALIAQNYKVQGYELGPEFSLQPNTSHRITGNLQYSERQNVGAEEHTRLWKLGLEYRFNQQSNRTLNAYLRYTGINHKGSTTSQAAYEMMEGLNPGKNLTLSMQLQQKLSQGLQLLVSYEGRKSEGLKLIHLGKVQANLLF